MKSSAVSDYTPDPSPMAQVRVQNSINRRIAKGDMNLEGRNLESEMRPID